MIMEELSCIPPPPSSSIDAKTGFCKETGVFHSLRPPVPLPPQSLPLSFPSFAFSLLPSPLPSNPAYIDATIGLSLSYSDFISQVRSLSNALRAQFRLSKGDVAFVLSSTRLEVPILYFALLSLGVVVSPANHISSPSEISRLVELVNPSIVFATSSTASKLPAANITVTTLLLDSPDFGLLLTDRHASSSTVLVHQTDAAAILFSSGTTGHVKAAAISHRSFIAMTAGDHALRAGPAGGESEAMLLLAPMVHSLGFFFALKGPALGDTTVVMSRSGLEEMLGVAEKYKATTMTLAPPVVVAMARLNEAANYDLRSLKTVVCGGAPLPVEVAQRFRARFPQVDLLVGYGSTEAGEVSRMIDAEESKHMGSVGRLRRNVEAKIVDTMTGKALSVGQQGELMVRGAAVMIGYLGNTEANASTFDSDGWLKTGDLCYFSSDGFLYIVDRLKELIKYKAYQVPPAELEHLLHTLPDIVDAAVVPCPQEEVGQIPMAFVVRQPRSNLSEEQVIDYVANKVAPYKKIRKVVFIDSIPKSPSGKILRRELASRVFNGPISTS